MKKFLLSSIFLFTCVFISVSAPVSGKSLDELQRRFVDLRFGMFIHFNMPTFVNEDGRIRTLHRNCSIRANSTAAAGPKPRSQQG